jgi:hypothetical protein
MLLSNGEWRQMDKITTALAAAVIWNQELNQTTFLTAIKNHQQCHVIFQIELKS